MLMAEFRAAATLSLFAGTTLTREPAAAHCQKIECGIGGLVIDNENFESRVSVREHVVRVFFDARSF
jgi:hypothetical protein